MMDSTVIVTGGNTGLGFETAKAILRDRAHLVVIACRSPMLGQEAVRELERDGSRAVFLLLDLGEPASVRSFVQAFRAAKLPPLAAIICNAGMQNVAQPQRTSQGYETTFAVNYLGHYLLVRLLLDDIAQGGSITFVSSGTHDPAQKTGVPSPAYTDADAAAHDLEPGRNAGLRRYTTSKLCNILCTYELSRRLKASNDGRLKTINVNAVNPGIMPGTGLARTWPKPMQWAARIVMPLMRLTNKNVHSPATSARRIAAVTIGTEAKPGGRYFSNGSAVRSSEFSYNTDVQRELWASSADMTGLDQDIRT